MYHLNNENTDTEVLQWNFKLGYCTVSDFKTKQKILLTKPLNNILFEVNGITIQAGELQTFISTWMMILCYHVDMLDRTTELALQHCKVWSYQA